jgi:uncharacterized protein (TIGR02117 family)
MKILFLSVTILMITACSSLPLAVQQKENYTASGPNAVYVVNHGWHTGFVIPSVPIHKVIPEIRQRFPDVPFIEIGWGDKGFYQASEITSGLTIQAIFWPTESVIHSVAVPYDVNKYFPHSEIEKLCLTDSELKTLITFISDSFAKDNNGNVYPLKKGLYGDSQFYKGSGDYYLMNTCNKWTAKGLLSAGMDISPTFKLTAGSIMNYLRAAPSQSDENHTKPVAQSLDCTFP